MARTDKAQGTTLTLQKLLHYAPSHTLQLGRQDVSTETNRVSKPILTVKVGLDHLREDAELALSVQSGGK